MTDAQEPAAVHPDASWYRRAQLPLLTVGVFALIAVLLWLNAIVNRYRFNVAIAVVGSVPLAILLVRAAAAARRSPGGVRGT